MKKKRQITLFVYSLILSISWIHAQTSLQTAALEKLIEDKVANEYFEGTVLIAEQGEPILQRTYGFKDRERTTSINENTTFNIASITKMLTAIVILQLVEEDKLSLDTPLVQLLPDLEIPNSEQITPHHLLLHITGLPNENSSFYRKSFPPEAYLKSVLSNGTANSTFGNYNYANIDYVLLGIIIERLSGSSWQLAIEERIIRKLGLTNTGFLKKGNYPENYAWPFLVNRKGSFIPDPDFHIENYYAAGCMYSNAGDILKIDQAMYTEALLNKESKSKMFTSYPEYNYTGYSVWTYNYPFLDPQPKIMERRGGILGSNSVLVRFLDTNKTLIILSNNNRFNPDSFGDFENLREALIMEIGKAGSKP